MLTAQSSPQQVIALIAARVAGSSADFVTALTDLTSLEVSALQHDQASRDLLRASIDHNVHLLIRVLATGADPRSEPPPEAALAYARSLAQSDASLASLLRAYRIGQARFTEHCLEVAGALDQAVPTGTHVALVNLISSFIDHICEHVAAAYESEHATWISGREGLRQQWVGRVLSGSPFEVAAANAALEYDLRGHHVAMELWTSLPLDQAATGLDQMVDQAKLACGARRVLTVARSHRHLQVWFEVRQERTTTH